MHHAWSAIPPPRALPKLAFLAILIGVLVPGTTFVVTPILLAIHMLRVDSAQAELYRLIQAGPPPRPLQAPTEREGERSLVHYAWVGPVVFLLVWIALPLFLLSLGARL